MLVLEQIATALILIMKGLFSLSIIAFMLYALGSIVRDIINDRRTK